MRPFPRGSLATLATLAAPARAALAGVIAVSILGCDKSGPLAELEPSKGSGGSPPAVPSTTASAANESASGSASAHEGRRVMPERPVPTSSPTVLITMPEEVQLKAIQYMAAMQAPQPSDAPADPEFAKQIAEQLRGAGKTDVVSSGRRIDILLDKGCDASLPREAIAHRTGASLITLLSRGVLVLRCADHAVQCLQSTRDANDVLCTHK